MELHSAGPYKFKRLDPRQVCPVNAGPKHCFVRVHITVLWLHTGSGFRRPYPYNTSYMLPLSPIIYSLYDYQNRHAFLIIISLSCSRIVVDLQALREEITEQTQALWQFGHPSIEDPPGFIWAPEEPSNKKS